MQYIMIENIKYNTTKHNEIRFDTILYVQYNTIQSHRTRYNTIEYTAIQELEPSLDEKSNLFPDQSLYTYHAITLAVESHENLKQEKKARPCK